MWTYTLSPKLSCWDTRPIVPLSSSELHWDTEKMCGVSTFFLLVKHVGIPLASRWKQEEVWFFFCTTINLCNRWHDIPTKKNVWHFIWMPILPQSLSGRKMVIAKGQRSAFTEKFYIYGGVGWRGTKPYAAGGGGGAGARCPPPPRNFQSNIFYTQIFDFQIVLSVNLKIMQLKWINHKSWLHHCHWRS